MASFKELIKNHLDTMAQQDAAFAERYKLESKSLDECLQYINQEARKQATNGCAAIEDAVVYGWAAHYYQEDNIKVGNVKAKVTTSKPKATTTPTKPVVKEIPPIKEVKPIKALVSDKKNNGKCVEMDLFAGMF